MPPREAQRLSECRAREPHDADRQEPEVDDDDAGIVVAAEEERHDGHEHEGAQRRGLRDVSGLREVGPDAARPIELEGAEGQAPDDQDRQQHQEVGPERRDVAVQEPAGRARRTRMKYDRTQHDATSAEVAGQHELLEELRVRLQHWSRSASRPSRYALTRSLNSGRSKASARRLRAFGSKRPGVALELADGEDQILDRLPLEERPVGGSESLAAPRVSRAPPRPRAITGRPEAIASSGRDAEVLDRGEEERAAARVQLGHLGIVAPPEELDVRIARDFGVDAPRDRCRRRRAAARADSAASTARSIRLYGVSADTTR